MEESAICCRFPDRQQIADSCVRFVREYAVCPFVIPLCPPDVLGCHSSQEGAMVGATVWLRVSWVEVCGLSP